MSKCPGIVFAVCLYVEVHASHTAVCFPYIYSYTIDADGGRACNLELTFGRAGIELDVTVSSRICVSIS